VTQIPSPFPRAPDGPQPTLHTERLILRPFVPGDAAEVHRIVSDREIAANTAHIPHPYPDGMALEWIEQEDFTARSYDEKLLAYRTYMRLAGPASLTYFKELALRKPSLFGGQKAVESRRAAVVALGSLQTPAAHLQLEEWGRDGDRALKEYAAEALKSKA
jgi:hypothetical protein